MNNPHEKFMRLAVEKAKEGILQGQTPFGACVVCDDEVVACAHNAVWRDTDITAHAEVNALRLACQKLNMIDLSGCVIYSTCEPCPMCFSAIHWAKIRTVFYGASISDARDAGFHELEISNEQMKKFGNSPIKINGGILKQECLGLFDLWSGSGSRRVY